MQVTCEVRVDRPRAVVAAYMFDPEHDAEWTPAVIRCRPLTEGRLRVGSRVERTVRFGGREFTYVYEVTAAQGDDFVELRVQQPFPMTVRYDLSDSSGGTRVRIWTRGEPKGFFRLAVPLMQGRVRRQIEGDLATLKLRLEQPA
ncbi:MAG TPA: SRPBCC family protein [Thermoplasmata archaeon]|nr:SRPBCC family protein [Thermoplasmata archaeon]